MLTDIIPPFFWLVTRSIITVAVTGHCRLGDVASVHFVERALTVSSDIVALSGLAAGADTSSAETDLARDIPLAA